MALMKHKVVVTLKLPQLQNFIKRDPVSYREEFMMQYKHYESELDIFKLRPTFDSQRFTDLITFMSHVGPCYKTECQQLPLQMMELMETNANSLHPDVRFKLFQCLVQLHNKDMIDPVKILQLAFKLFSVQDKNLRIAVGDFIINDIKGLNKNKNNEKVNRKVQALLFDILAEDTTIAARKTIYILSELYRRKIWTDSRTVNVIASACKSNSTRVMIAALNFFLGIENRMHEDEEEDSKNHSMGAKMVNVEYHEHSKKTKAKARKIKLQTAAAKKAVRQHDKKQEEAVPLFPAIQLIHDPQSLAEELFKRLRKSCERFEVKLVLMNLISRLVGCHELILLPFYSFIQRYLTSHQQDVTVILTYLIQACHSLVPPEEIVPIVKAISFNFITERCTNEVLAIGLNSVREIIRRIPALLREDGMDDFISDLAQYSRKTHKSVMIAAHGVVNLVRDLYPTLLHKSHRGKFYNVNSFPAQYGEVSTKEGVEGAHLLDAYERGDIEVDSDGEVYYKEDRLKDVYGNDILEEENSDDSEDEDSDEAPELVDMREFEVIDEPVDEKLSVRKGKGKVIAQEEDEEGDWEDASDDEEEEESDADEGEWEDVEQSPNKARSLKKRKASEDVEEEEEDKVSKNSRSSKKRKASEEVEEEEEEEEDDDDDEEEEEEEEFGDDDEGEWEEMEEDDDEEEEEEEQSSRKSRKKGVSFKAVEDAKKARARAKTPGSGVDSRRLLSTDDFDLLEKLKAAQRERDQDPKFRFKRKLEKLSSSGDADGGSDDEDGLASTSYSLDPGSIAPARKSYKSSKIERVQRILEGRKENRFEHEGHAGGLTNKEKQRKKNFLMVRKGKSSVSQKGRSKNSVVRDNKLKQKDQKGREKRKRRRT